MKSIFTAITFLVFIFLSPGTNAQITSASQWTWVKGDNISNQPGIYGMQGTPAAANRPGGRQGSVTWTDASGKLWLFGGYGYDASGSGRLNDLWKYDPATNLWTWVQGDNIVDQLGIYGTQGTQDAANRPGGREGSVTWTDGSGNLWLFGGYGPDASGFGRLNDLWKYDPGTNQWTWVKGDDIIDQPGIYGTQGTAAAANRPGGRDGSVTWTDGSGNLWLFGGNGYTASGFGYLNDLWKYDPATNQWTWVKGDNTSSQPGIYGTQGTPAAANKPGARYYSVSWTDASGILWLFGGNGYAQSGSDNLNDLWNYNIATNQWTWVKGDNSINQPGIYGTQGTPAAANKPGARYHSVSWTDASGILWLFGGYGYAQSGSGNLNDLWNYNIATNQWTWVKGDNSINQPGIYGTQGTPAAANKPGARYIGVSWRDASGNLWLFGGYGPTASGGDLNDLWKLGSSAVVLPVTFISISAKQTNTGNQLAWKMAEEQDIIKYDLYRSATGANFTKVNTVVATPSKYGLYDWLDPAAPAGLNFYRVAAVAHDGRLTYSAVAKAGATIANSAITIAPNPVQGRQINLQFVNEERGNYSIRIMNNAGGLIHQSVITHDGGNGSYSVVLPHAVAKGAYQLVVMKNDKSRHTETLVVAEY